MSEPIEPTPNEIVTIRCREDGPLVITGPVRIVDAEGNEFHADLSRGNIALCRCGYSEQRPFCDGSHRKRGFVAKERASSS